MTKKHRRSDEGDIVPFTAGEVREMVEAALELRDQRDAAVRTLATELRFGTHPRNCGCPACVLLNTSWAQKALVQ